jgi:hypothetical protein
MKKLSGSGQGHPGSRNRSCVNFREATNISYRPAGDASHLRPRRRRLRHLPTPGLQRGSLERVCAVPRTVAWVGPTARRRVSAVALFARSGSRIRSDWCHRRCAIRRQYSILRPNRTGRSCSLLARPCGVTTYLRSRRYVNASPRRLSTRGACAEHPTPLQIHPACSHVPALPGPCPSRRHSVELTLQGEQ